MLTRGNEQVSGKGSPLTPQKLEGGFVRTLHRNNISLQLGEAATGFLQHLGNAHCGCARGNTEPTHVGLELPVLLSDLCIPETAWKQLGRTQ